MPALSVNTASYPSSAPDRGSTITVYWAGRPWASAIPAGSTGLGLVHNAIGDMFPEWAVLRPSWFMQNLADDPMHAHSIRARGEIGHRSVVVDTMRQRLIDTGIPDGFAALLAGMDHAIASGAEDRTTTTVTDVNGHAPISFREFCTAHAQRWQPGN